MVEFRERLRWFYSPPRGADRSARLKWLFEYLGFIFAMTFVLAGLAYYFPGAVLTICAVALALVLIVVVIVFLAATLG